MCIELANVESGGLPFSLIRKGRTMSDESGESEDPVRQHARKVLIQLRALLDRKRASQTLDPAAPTNTVEVEREEGPASSISGDKRPP